MIKERRSESGLIVFMWASSLHCSVMGPLSKRLMLTREGRWFVVRWLKEYYMLYEFECVHLCSRLRVTGRGSAPTCIPVHSPPSLFFFGLQWEKVRWNDDREWWSQVQWFVPILESTIYQPLSNLVNQHNNKSVKQSKQLNFLLLIPRVFWLHVGATRMFDASETMERASSQTAGRRSTDR